MEGHNLDTPVRDINFQRYCSCVFEVGQRVMCRAFLYLYHHYHQDPNVYVGQRLDGIPNGWARIGAIGKAALARRESPINMDICLLYILLQRTCGLKPDTQNNSVWNSPISDTVAEELEHKLYLLKEIRNDLAHNTNAYLNLTKQELIEKVNVLERLCCNIVTKAAIHTGRSSNTVATDTARITSQLHDILTSSLPPKIHPQEWLIMAHEEQRAALPQSQEFFAQAHLRLPRNQEAQAKGDVDFLHTFLSWRYSDGSPIQVIIVKGQAGVGKTKFCKELWKLSVSSKMTDSTEYDLVVKVECSQVTTRDVGRLIKEELLPQASQDCDPGQVVNLLTSLRVVWLLDGMEEPAPEAIHLLQQIINKFSDKHLVVVTCQHSYVNEVLTRVQNKRVVEITLEGLSNNGFHSLLKHLLKKEQLYSRFVEDTKDLNAEVVKELFNPLKLTLAVTLWQEGTLDLGNKASFPQLYSAVEAALVVKVSARMADKWGLTTQETRDRIYAWLKELCCLAFHMTLKNQLVSLDKHNTELLKEKSLLLLPSYSDCFSTFLTSQRDINSSETTYRFIHLSQQYYLAAQYVCQQLLSDSSQELMSLLHVDVSNVTDSDVSNVTDTDVNNVTDTDVNNVTDSDVSNVTDSDVSNVTDTDVNNVTDTDVNNVTDSDVNNVTDTDVNNVTETDVNNVTDTDVNNVTDTSQYDQLYDTLLWVFSILDSRSELNERIEKTLTSVLSHCRRCDWMEVVRHAGYSDNLARLVGQYMSDTWYVTDRHIGAATLLLKHTTPSLLSVNITANHNSLHQHLMPFLEQVALADTKSELFGESRREVVFWVKERTELRRVGEGLWCVFAGEGCQCGLLVVG
ncbi:hypothetical protein Pcinc_034549 [Petrolisthes cinctipes]|uniref:NACHT domain-containing protein n=1 Tax=Petrolisthes cinctipes TaxID=88211 RepID=A0AAE1EQ19_PETCI|nr:hypothetical protein Pcinc_034549 [Petrolisthes cinctipes]